MSRLTSPMFQRENVETILIIWTTLNANERDSEDLGISSYIKKKKKKKLWETNFVTNYLQQTSTSTVLLFSLGDLGRYGRLDLHSTSLMNLHTRIYFFYHVKHSKISKNAIGQ